MPGRRMLKGIADGYWALGILYTCATDFGDNKFILDVPTGESEPYFKYSKRVAKPYRDFLFEQTKKFGFKEYQIKKACLMIIFNTSPTRKHVERRYTWGEPFICEMNITDDFGRNWKMKSDSWCGQHNRNKEGRSTRRYVS